MTTIEYFFQRFNIPIHNYTFVFTGIIRMMHVNKQNQKLSIFKLYSKIQ